MNHNSDPPDHEPESRAKAAALQLQQRMVLKKISRARMRLLVCFWTLPVYVIGLWVLLSNGQGIDSFMFIYMVLYAGFALDMSMRRCPLCKQQFFVKSILLNLITHKCLHCGACFNAEAAMRFGEAKGEDDEMLP
jgi:hypothetical protein